MQTTMYNRTASEEITNKFQPSNSYILATYINARNFFPKFIGKTLASSENCCTFAVNKSDTGIYTLSQYILIASLCGLLTLMSDLFTHIARHFFIQTKPIK